MRSIERLVRYDVRASIAHAEMLQAQRLLSAQDLQLIRDGLIGARPRSTSADCGTSSSPRRTARAALERRLTERIGAGRRPHPSGPFAQRPGAHGAAAVPARGDRRSSRPAHAARGRARSIGWPSARRQTPLPGYTHMQQAMPSSVPLWAGGYAAELRDDAQGIASVRRRIDKNPLGSAAGYGTPGLPLDRDATTRALGFDCAQQPVTAVQLSRGKAEAQLLFELALLMRDLGRLAADLLLFYTQEFAFVELPDAFTTGSSIMPQKRNPDVFELVRGRSASALACADRGARRSAPSCPPAISATCSCSSSRCFAASTCGSQTLDIVAAALDALKFRPERIRLDPAVHAAEEALCAGGRGGHPFREAYRTGRRALHAQGIDAMDAGSRRLSPAESLPRAAAWSNTRTGSTACTRCRC